MMNQIEQQKEIHVNTCVKTASTKQGAHYNHSSHRVVESERKRSGRLWLWIKTKLCSSRHNSSG